MVDERRPVPEWFHDAKFGIFVHWGLYSVPAWAPPGGDLGTVQATGDWAAWFTDNAYAEWYWNSMHIPGSPTARHHDERYGGAPYEAFREPFEEAVGGWDPAEMVDLFVRAGARYVVPTTKHHDGFRLWPSAVPNPAFGDYHLSRDLVGELGAAVRAAGLRFGTYYSGGIDWTFNPHVVQDIADLARTVPQSDEYIAYADAHWRELTERYEPALMWNDIAYPAGADLDALFADYYRAVPDGVINDRFKQEQSPLGEPPRQHHDFVTPEYTSFKEIQPRKWESTRGIGHSFGYNQRETDEEFIAPDALIHMLVDVVSKNGNLLLNVGPRADGGIQEEQRSRLLALGAWLETNGEAIYGTRPWRVAEGTTAAGEPVRFTAKGDTLYAVVLAPAGGMCYLNDLAVAGGSQVRVLGHPAPLEYGIEDGGITVALPNGMPESPAYAVAIMPAPADTG